MKTQENRVNFGLYTHKHFYRKDKNYLKTIKNNSNKVKPTKLDQITVGAIINCLHFEGKLKNILSNNAQNIKREYKSITKQNCRGTSSSSGSKGLLKKQKETVIKEAGITLIALAITIIILIILARSNNKNDNRRKWINNKSKRNTETT